MTDDYTDSTHTGKQGTDSHNNSAVRLQNRASAQSESEQHGINTHTCTIDESTITQSLFAGTGSAFTNVSEHHSTDSISADEHELSACAGVGAAERHRGVSNKGAGAHNIHQGCSGDDVPDNQCNSVSHSNISSQSNSSSAQGTPNIVGQSYSSSVLGSAVKAKSFESTPFGMRRAPWQLASHTVQLNRYVCMCVGYVYPTEIGMFV
jgi:hypothetical protein